MRLDKLLSHLSIVSRSGCREWLRSHQVQINGQPALNPAVSVPAEAVITVDGMQADTRMTRHVMLNKPLGVVTAREDNRQPAVMELLPPVYTSLSCMPVGRLDKDTTGLLLLTTDGELAHRLIAPQRHVNKVYVAEVNEPLQETDQASFAAGIQLSDFAALPAQLQILSERVGQVTIQEGKYHQVRRMFAACGKTVIRLHRISFGPLRLHESLSPGQFRELTQEEADALYAAAELSHA